AGAAECVLAGKTRIQTADQPNQIRSIRAPVPIGRGWIQTRLDASAARYEISYRAALHHSIAAAC
ncbi:MAG TPA: hypothetical protein VLK84_01915, partial [Longimicrobium sp.]|nr:hypothetical protein [Longimicrobium sp.]